MHSRILFKGTAAAVAARRIRHILGPVMSKEGWNCSAHEVKLLNTSSGDTVKIGEISYRLKTPRNPELVPVNHSDFGLICCSDHFQADLLLFYYRYTK
ncbi:von Willebrand factor A domain-containing protein 8 [Anabarilius grahami]|uniref:von Willebrand factor A domain-containing protein 8 n=1 Tax=Anabarilius grahami TaxID=495550 RepID=A0A3N0Z900_ANAGA|nr:von Willebrand factor A domain-containing protein 8 [Anabarilius grahami]